MKEVGGGHGRNGYGNNEYCDVDDRDGKISILLGYWFANLNKLRLPEASIKSLG